MQWDRGDVRLLRELQRDGRASNVELAARVGLSESTCSRKVRQLEASGAIERYAAIVDQRAVGLPLSVFVTVTLESQSEVALKAFEHDIAEVPEVMECYLMTGTADYLIRVAARDIDDLERIHSSRLTRIRGVARVTSSIAMRRVVRRLELPIESTASQA